MIARGFFVVLASLLANAALPHQPAEQLASHTLVCRLLAGPAGEPTFVTPISRPAGSDITDADISFDRLSPEQRAAFRYAVDIWRSEVASVVALQMSATMSQHMSASELAETQVHLRVAPSDSPFELLPEALYSQATGVSGAGMSIRFNAAVNWYYGTDGRPGPGQYDFVSAALHEIGHGLGLHGTMQSDGARGQWGRPSFHQGKIPVLMTEIYDRFTENGSGVGLLAFSSPSTALHAQLTGEGGGLFWNGDVAQAVNGGVKPKLFAPGTFQEGSTYRHLDEATYPLGSANSLMTPVLGANEAIHDVGAITRGMLSDLGWPTSARCAPSVSALETFYPPGGTASVSVVAHPGCQWTATSESEFVTIIGGASGTGSGTVTLAVSPNTGSAREGRMRIGDVLRVVRQTLPRIEIAPYTLRWHAIRRADGTLASTTADQHVTVTQSAAGTVHWTATTDVPWLEVKSASGVGPGRFTLGIKPSAVIYGSHPDGLRGSYSVSSPGAFSNSGSVILTLSDAVLSAPPFGQVDTPIQNASGVQGSIAVTGWALDDLGVTKVEIYRNCLPVDAGQCTSIGGRDLVFVGNASFVDGARPDIERVSAFRHYPQLTRSGWGYLLLTNMLPNVPANLPYGGQGTVTLYAVATDVEGQRTFLGRQWLSDRTPTTITMANASLAKPFGAIDTPGQGEVVSGLLANFGWALTPDSNSSADAADIVVPMDGSTMNVVIDGAAVGTVNYNQCRGTVGNPVPSGLYCNDDVSNAFGHTTPQPPFTIRTANPTLFRNLDAGRAPIGVFEIDTALLANGRHSIAWGVTDSAGRSEGIGSRDFIVLNGSSLMTGQTSATMMAGAEPTVGRVADLANRPLSQSAVSGRVGFDFARALEQVLPDSAGVRHIQFPELGRLELWLGAGVTAGYLTANENLRALPPGSWLDLASGRFTWSPIVGYSGLYELVFLDGAAQMRIHVTITPKSSATTGSMIGYIDSPANGATLGGTLTVAGWAMDLGAWQGSGVGAVHVWAHPIGTPGGPAVFLGAAELAAARPDVAAAFGVQGERSGWWLTASDLPAGRYQLISYFWSTRTGRFEDARVISIAVR